MKMGMFEKHLFVLVALIFVVAFAVCVGGLVFWAVTNLGQAVIVAAVIAAVIGIVHIIVRKIDWDKVDVEYD